ncbi:uncharacterized protein I303_102401 [Kwoniella dejecticola CBS 10117]|uniref:Amino acid transporter transmembrane domain-containing protein n=1 Tax=Kwoniella dejecticola CBS 10117 TaxID=1296121 RepID=A0AAJ8MFH0_9TREE
MSLTHNEKMLDTEPIEPSIREAEGDPEDFGEVFQSHTGEANFRAPHWIPAAIILLKLCFATGVLGIPFALVVTGWVPGTLLIIGWGLMCVWYAYIMYQFRFRFAGVHTIADAMFIIGGPRYGPAFRELTGALFLLCWILATGTGLIGMSTGMSVLSNYSVCAVVFTAVAAIATFAIASIRTLGKLSWLTWAGFGCIFVSVFIVVVGVTTVDRPAAAPKEGPYDLGIVAIGSPTFVPGLTAAINLLACYGSTPTFLPVVAEMRHPKDFIKSLLVSQIFLAASFLSFGLTLYFYCGQYVASPSLGSAGDTIEKIAYGIALFGLLMTSVLWAHIAAKFLMVRILKGSIHLQKNTKIHWGTWIGCSLTVCGLSFIIAEAIPFFSYLIGLIGSTCYWKAKTRTSFNYLSIAVGSFLTVAGTYTTIQSIIDAYASDSVGKAFAC